MLTTSLTLFHKKLIPSEHCCLDLICCFGCVGARVCGISTGNEFRPIPTHNNKIVSRPARRLLLLVILHPPRTLPGQSGTYGCWVMMCERRCETQKSIALRYQSYTRDGRSTPRARAHLRKSVTPANRSGRLDSMWAFDFPLSIESDVTPTVNVPPAHILWFGHKKCDMGVNGGKKMARGGGGREREGKGGRRGGGYTKQHEPKARAPVANTVVSMRCASVCGIECWGGEMGGFPTA